MKGRTQDRSFNPEYYLELYKGASPIDQELLQALAVLHVPCDADDLIGMIARVPRARCATLGPDVIKSKLSSLEEVGVLSSAEEGLYQLPIELSQELTSQLVWAQRYEAFNQAARAQLPLLELACQSQHSEADQAQLREGGSELLLFALRDALYREERSIEELERLCALYEELFPEDFYSLHPYLKIFDMPFREQWFSHFSQRLTAHLLISLLLHKLSALRDPKKPLEALEGLFRSVKDEEVSDEIYYFLSIFYRLRGRPSVEWLNERSVPERRQGWSLSARAMQLLIEGSYESAMAGFHRAWRVVREDKALQQRFMTSPFGPLFVLTALNQRQHNITNNQVLTLASRILIPMHSGVKSAWRTDLIYPLITQVIAPYVDLEIKHLEPTLSTRNNHGLLWLFEALYGIWHYGEDYSTILKPLNRLYQRASKSNYLWLAAEAATLISHLDPQDLKAAQEAERLHERIGTQSLLNLHPVKLGWRKLIERLRDVGRTRQNLDTRLSHSQDRRLLWVTGGEPVVGEFQFKPRLQERAPSSRKSKLASSWEDKTYRLTLKDLYRDHIEHAPYLTPQDHRVCAQMIVAGQRDRADWEMYSERDFKFDPIPALVSLVGHPLLFKRSAQGKRGGERKSMSLYQEKPTLRVIYPDDNHLSLSLTPKFEEMPQVEEDAKAYILQALEGSSYRIIECSRVHRQIAELLDQDIRIPRDQQALLNTAIDQLSNYVSVQADLGEVDGITEHAMADATPILIFLETDESAIKVQIRVRPFAQSENLMRPGEGGSVLSTVIGGRRLRVERDLEDESARRQALLDDCVIFEKLRQESGDWLIEQQEQYLELLLQVRMHEGEAHLQMPEGKEIRVDRPEVAQGAMKLKVEKDTAAWFKIDGSLEIDEAFSLSIKELLLKERVGRFITMGNGEFVALSEEFARTLDELKEAAEVTDKGVRFRGTSAALVNESLSHLKRGQVEGDRHWSSILKKINSVGTLMPPEELNAELRDYQLDGFRWLSGFAMLETNAGVCLADDMGLGKTLQALSLLLARSKRGPSLVIAPTSVVQNWINEANRFTPTLKVSRFGGTREHRERLVRSAGPHELIICTYGLLKTEIELLSEQQWNVLVLDEAQNIKNHTTQAAKAAVRLRSRFRFVTTGTPIENNLTELWSLFQFLNPHLLKGLKDFKDRFLNPIERDDSQSARRKLNQLISPFILRRTKESVLDDLPPITELVHSIELSDDERQLYESVKREQLADIERQLSHGDTGARMELFALLTKLRQLSCHPRLVFPEIDTISSKLSYFEELVRQIIDGGHKVLVFSQFVRHLDLIGQSLERMMIPYQYLTGETSYKERQRRVDAFQAGEGEVFLISLKAGGVGLNLTAADYVIHMDPWWNPAVEDQASDRAHRIGQERPVTVYRLVGKDTIEEQIVSLHQYKRDLADAILEGSNKTLNTDDLLSLLREQMSVAAERL